MKYSRTTTRFLLLTSLLAVATVAVAAQEKRPVVVELFTSQGCSSCPPANANLTKLSRHPNVLALSFAVTYWDYLGWKDSFGKPEFTNRQVVYEPALGEKGPFTPQMVVNGQESNVGFRLHDVETLVREADTSGGPAVSITRNSTTVAAGKPPANAVDVWLVRYDPRTVDVPVERGENSGSTLPHTNVVNSLERLGSWTGSKVTFDFTAAPVGLRTAVLVQGSRGGPILTAAHD